MARVGQPAPHDGADRFQTAVFVVLIETRPLQGLDEREFVDARASEDRADEPVLAPEAEEQDPRARSDLVRERT